MVGIAGAAVAAVGSIASGVIGAGAQSSAATKARRAQETAAQKQLDWDRHMWSYEQVQREPWVQQGRDALTNLSWQAQAQRDNPALWYQRGAVDPQYRRWQSTPTVSPTAYQRPATIDPSGYRFDPSAYTFQGPQAVDPSQYRFDSSRYGYNPMEAYNAPVLDPEQYRYSPTETGTLGRFDFKPPEVTDDPGYAFRLRQGQEALDASAAARGGLGSGATQKALMRYGQDLGSQEYGAAYGRSWQQQQEQYERQRLMNMTEEERQRYANQTAYGRGLTANQQGYERGWAANMTTEERQRYADATRFSRDFEANRFNLGAMTAGQEQAWRQAQAENEMRYGRALAGNERDYGRDVQRQGLEYSQGLAADDLYYRRLIEENALRESRGLAANQLEYGRDVAFNETANARAWQEYAANIAAQERNWNQYAQLAGYGMQQQNNLGQLGLSYANNIGSAYAGMGNATSAGNIASGNAAANMWSNVGQGLSGAANTYMMWNAMQPQSRGLTSGTLPTTWGAYNAGGYSNPYYAPFGQAPA